MKKRNYEKIYMETVNQVKRVDMPAPKAMAETLDREYPTANLRNAGSILRERYPQASLSLINRAVEIFLAG